MISTSTAIKHLAGQGGNPVKMTIAADALAAAGLVPTDDRQPLNAEQAVALLLGCCSPIPEDAAQFALERGALHCDNVSLRAVMVGHLSDASNPPAAVHILHQQPHVVIYSMTDEVPAEFGSAFSCGGFRTETIISGGLLSLMAMKLKDRS